MGICLHCGGAFEIRPGIKEGQKEYYYCGPECYCAAQENWEGNESGGTEETWLTTCGKCGRTFRIKGKLEKPYVCSRCEAWGAHKKKHGGNQKMSDCKCGGCDTAKEELESTYLKEQVKEALAEMGVIGDPRTLQIKCQRIDCLHNYCHWCRKDDGKVVIDEQQECRSYSKF